MHTEVGVDWITTTWGEGGLDKDRLYATLDAMYGAQWRIAMSNWASLGYVGYKVGKLAWGDRHDGHIVVVTGGDAQHYVKNGGPTGQNVSRLDLQVTVWDKADADLDITQYRDIALERRDALHGRWRISHIDGCGGGNTLYIGSRQSEMFIRVYNKGAESGDSYYEGTVRYEVELKGERARTALDTIRDGNFDERAVLGALLDVFGRRGLDFGFGDMATWTNLGTARRAATDSEKQLNWLKCQVRPTVRKLLNTHDRAILLEALGLSQDTTD